MGDSVEEGVLTFVAPDLASNVHAKGSLGEVYEAGGCGAMQL